MMYKKSSSLLLGLLMTITANSNTVINPPLGAKQDVNFYLKTNFALEKSVQKKHVNIFLQHYFSPWDLNYPATKIADTKSAVLSVFKKFAITPGWNANMHPHDAQWLKAIEKNSDLAHFPNLNARAITIRDTNVRLIPTNEPSFNDIFDPGKSLQFDSVQQSFITAATPIFIYHKVKNGTPWVAMVLILSLLLRPDRLIVI